MGRNKGTLDHSHSKRSAQRHAKALRSKKDGYEYKVEKNFESFKAMKAKALIEFMCNTEAPVKEPGVKPGVRPAAPPPKRREHQNPFSRRPQIGRESSRERVCQSVSI